jgi:hypothetical protein
MHSDVQLRAIYASARAGVKGVQNSGMMNWILAHAAERRTEGGKRMLAESNFELDALFARLPGLDHGELLALAGEHGTEHQAREHAWETVHRVVSAEHVERDLDRIRSQVGSWATQLGSIAGQQIGSGMSDEPMADARRAAAPAVLEAAVAYLLGTRLPEPDRAALLRPWESVIAG